MTRRSRGEKATLLVLAVYLAGVLTLLVFLWVKGAPS